MKCKYCSAPITLEDEFCPYCGALNEQARQHIQDMKHYNADYELTRNQVLENAGRQSRRHGRLFLIAGLVILNLACIVLSVNSYEISYLLQERQINRESALYKNIMLDMEEQGKYRELSLYYNRNSLYLADSLREFRSVTDLAGDYARIVDDIYYLKHEEARSYYSEGQQLGQLADHLEWFYRSLSMQDHEFYGEEFQEPHLGSIQEMKERVEDLLMSQCSLGSEDVERLPQMENQDILLLIGRRMGIYE